ncbi:hypothetical protein Htur_1226 [Haloterrigena turkmenica DSM 5511]|uniref:Uncharacterized protein n=1 Tax=Haloterrigena turkmenica (strain ATCC 51198 / DSM 5511 / JCM 9101 / NCIMB 13204 / VKM B-1734 / 4k) TaxID=543526 RepID=D2RP83_HALTV|nr:hypothetical protein [Haloterrigena turkmenica]ADB60117.1 hypothetical protein Htur_1226 [Haloterrigena turkmenica DSM 5511]
MTDSAVTATDDQEAEADTDTDHLDEVPDGAGCVEIWEKISEARDDD